MKSKLKIFILIVFGSICFQFGNASASPVHLHITPENIDIGTFYNGATVNVSGQVPTGSEVVIRLSGEGEELHLKKKGKVAGLLWMNTGDLTFSNAPKVYKLITGKGIKNLDTSAAREFGFTALKNRIEISPKSRENDFLLKEFIRLKTKDDLYSIVPGGVSYEPAKGDMKSFQANIAIPSIMKPGDYSVEVAVVQNGRILDSSSKPLILQQISFPMQISNMAFGHALLYGIISVFIALMAGLVMGLLFKDKGGAH